VALFIKSPTGSLYDYDSDVAVPVSGHKALRLSRSRQEQSSCESVIISTPIPPSLTNAPIPWIVHPQHTGKALHSRYSPKRRHRHLSDQQRTLTHKNAFQTPQQQQPTRAQYPPTRRHSIASYRPALPSESRMPDEWGYPSSSVPHISSAPFFTDASYHSQYFGIGRYTKEHTGRHCTYDPYLSLPELPPSCDHG
jgi:hypothetical protein